MLQTRADNVCTVDRIVGSLLVLHCQEKNAQSVNTLKFPVATSVVARVTNTLQKNIHFNYSFKFVVVLNCRY